MFNIHGEWKIEVCGHVVVQWFSGAWNEEAIVTYVKEFQNKVYHLRSEQWAILSIFDDWELGVPEFEQHVIKHCDWFKNHGCVKDCHVYLPSASTKIQLERIIPHTDEYYERQVFPKVDEAITWLKSYDFFIENSEIIPFSKNKRNR